MPNVCILTDSTVQFTRPHFPGHELVYGIPFNLQSVEWKINGQPHIKSIQRLIPPQPEEFLHHFGQLSRQYDSILVITLSSFFSQASSNAQAAAMLYSNHATVQVVDSQTTAAGLGMLVQVAAEEATKGSSFSEIERRVRAAIHRIYMIFCIPQLTHLASGGYISYSQAVVGEMMGLLPVYTLEEGCLMPMEKVRTQRHLFEAFQEFIGEFRDPCHIALVRDANSNILRTRPIRQHVRENFPQTPFSEHTIPPHLAALFGPKSIGLVIMERAD